jgi:hypothetical protein
MKSELVITQQGSGVDLVSARAEIDASLRPAAKRDVAKWLGVLRAIAPHRRDTEEDEAIITQIYVTRLSVYPPDVVRHLCVSERWRFWPSIAELEDRADALVRHRRVLKRKVEELLAQQHPEPERERVSPERAQKIWREYMGDRPMVRSEAVEAAVGVGRQQAAWKPVGGAISTPQGCSR